jgi:hypothetical protein
MKRKLEEKLPKGKRQKLDHVNIQWKSATSFYNFMNNDTVLDFFQINKIHTKKQLETFIKTKKTPSFYKKTFSQKLATQGHTFEEHVFSFLEDKCKEKNISTIKICDSYKDIFKYESYKNTKNAIKKGIQIIFHGVLRNKINKTYGQSDIIIKGDALTQLFDVPFVDSDNYYIIDVKCSNLSVFANTHNLTNVKLYDCYRMQLYIYTECLKKITKKESTIAFLLPKKITMTKTSIENTNFDRLVSVYLFDRNINTYLNEAIDWNNNLYKNSKEWSLIPPSNKYLYPNMKNIYDNNLTDLKKYIAEKNGEITMLYRCGIEQRENALKHDITSLHDTKLTPEILGFQNTSSFYTIIKSMLECLHTNVKHVIPKENNILGWRTPCKEVFIDFETYNNWLYLIGILYEHTDEKGHTYFKYKSFFIDTLDKETEKANIISFLQFLQSLKVDKIWQWSTYEHTIITKKIGEYFIHMQVPVLYDMLDIFRDTHNPIVFKGVFNFSIKSLYTFLKQESFIDYEYQDVNNGFESMEIAETYYNTNQQDIKENLIYYNKIDCKLMYDILRYIRSNI